MSNIFNKIIRLANPNNTKGQSIDQYIVRGPEHEINPTNFNVGKIGDDSVSDFGNSYRLYWKLRKAGDKHSIAWDKAGCHGLPFEMQLQMRDAILRDDSSFYLEASSEGDFMKSLMGNREARESFSAEASVCPINNQIIKKREELINLGFDTKIVDRAASRVESKGFKVNFDSRDGEVVDIIRELTDAGLDVAQYDLNSAMATLGSPVQKDFTTASSLKTRKVCLIGAPGDKRSSIAKRLASFYNVPHLDIGGMVDKVIELGFYKDEEAEYIKSNMDKIKPKLLEIMFHMISDGMEGFVLEGYPVNKEHVCTTRVDGIVYLDNDMEGKVESQKDKRWCPTCMYSYHLKIHPPVRDVSKCDRCDSVLTVRPEDLPRTVKDSYYLWKKQFSGLLKELRKKDNLIELDISHSAEQAARVVERILSKKYKKTHYDDELRPKLR